MGQEETILNMIKPSGKLDMMFIRHQLDILIRQLSHATGKAHGMIHKNIDQSEIQCIAYILV